MDAGTVVGLPLASDLPTGTAVLIAVVTATAGLVGALAGGFFQSRSAKKQAEATAAAAKIAADASVEKGAHDRFAAWQGMKRGVYAELLTVARPLRTDSADPVKRANFRMQHDKAMLYANQDLRTFLKPLVEDPAKLDAEWDTLIEKLSADVRRTQAAD
jgi:hypothetical protein